MSRSAFNLLQYLLRQRRSTPAIQRHLAGPGTPHTHTYNRDDLNRLADNAYRRMQYALATRLHRALVDAGNPAAAIPLAELLGKLDELRALTDTGHVAAVMELTESLLVRCVAVADEDWTSVRLARKLVEQSKVGEAEVVLRNAADDDFMAFAELVDLLHMAGKGDELPSLVADAGGTNIAAAMELPRLLARFLGMQGKGDELHALAATGNNAAVMELAGLLDGRARSTRRRLC